MRNIASLFHLPFFMQQGRVQARMAELVDASDSKSGYRKVVQVRFLFRALNRTNQNLLWFVLFHCDKLSSKIIE